MSQRLVFVRHGVTEWNREGRWQGRLDPPLSEGGRREARMIADRLAADPDLRPARILSSTLARASETAAIIGASVGVQVEPEPRLVEIGAGEWEGRTHAELAAIDGERYRAWRTTPGYGPPGGEPISEATERVRSVLADVTASATWPVLLVSHGGTLRILARLLLDLTARAGRVRRHRQRIGLVGRPCRRPDVAARALERRAPPARPRAHPRRRGRGTPAGPLS